MRDLEEVIEEEELDERFSKERRMFNAESKVMNLRYMRSTGMKTSRRVFFPPGRNAKEEAGLEVRMGIWMNEYKKFMEENTKEGGEQVTKQLTPSQAAGRRGK